MHEFICVMHCEDCGPFAVAHVGQFSIFVLEDEASAVARCIFCDRIIVEDCPMDIVKQIAALDINVFDWTSGEKVE